MSQSFHANDVLGINFPAFSVRIEFHDATRLTVTVVEGENAGFTDTVEYTASTISDGIVVLSWQEHIGSTVVHVLDLTKEYVHTFVTSRDGRFLRMSGPVRRDATEADG